MSRLREKFQSLLSYFRTGRPERKEDMKLLVFMGDDYLSPSRSLVTVSGAKDKADPGESIMRRLNNFLLSTKDRFKLYYSGIIAMLRQQIDKAIVIIQTVIKTDLAQKLNPRIAALFLGGLAFTYAGYEYYPAYSSFINQEKKIIVIDLPSKNISNLNLKYFFLCCPIEKRSNLELNEMWNRFPHLGVNPCAAEGK